LLKFITRMIPLLVLLLLAVVEKAGAQGASVYFGAGSATNSATSDPTCPAPHELFDFVTMNCEPSPTMGGAFGVFGSDFMILPHLGFNFQYSFRFSQANYLPAGGLKARPSFYDFNAVFEPISGDSRVVPVLEGGIGGARLSLYFNQQSCATPSICQNFSQPVGAANHFQVHGAFGIKLYVTPGVFIKPQFDARWIDHWNQQYGNNFVPEYTMSIGYTFGRH
jgi:hypothetical protein